MAQYDFNLRDCARIFHKRKLLIILTFLAGIVCSIYLFPEPPPVFQSSATVKIEERKTFAGLLSEWMVYNPGDLMASQTKIIKGFPIMKKTALRLNMIQDDSETQEIHRAVREIQNKIDTERLGQTNIIRITASSENAQEAKDLAATVADVYVEENLLEKTEEARSTRQFIEEQLDLLENRLKGAEDRLKVFEEKNGDVDHITIDINRIQPLHEKLVEEKITLSTLEHRYTGKHPKIKEIRQQISELESRLENEVSRITVPKGISSAEKLDHARLTREVEINKKLYMLFKEKLEEARINEVQKVGDVSIVDPAVLPGPPVNTRDNINVIMIGSLIGLLLGIGLAFILESMDTSIGTIDDIERVVKLPVLGVLPSAKKEVDKRHLRNLGSTRRVKKNDAHEIYVRMITHHEPKSLIAESCRNIRTNLRLGPSWR